MVEVAVTNCRTKPYSKAWCIGLFLHYDRKQYLQAIVTLSPLPVIVCHLGYSAEKNKDEPEVVIYYNP